MFLVTSTIVIDVPTRGLLAVETMHAIVQWLANLNIKRNVTSMFVNKKHRYTGYVWQLNYTIIYGKQVHHEKENSDWFPELSEFCNTYS